MIRISKGNDFKEVTRGVYESIFKPLGYEPVIEAKSVEVKPTANKVVDKPKTIKVSSKSKTNNTDDALKSKYDVFDENESSDKGE